MGLVREADELQRLVENIPGRTLAAKLRRLLPDIDRRIREGVQHQEIVDALNRHGGFGAEVKLSTLRSYLFRYRKAKRDGTKRYGRRPVPPAMAPVRADEAVPSPPLLERLSARPRTKEAGLASAVGTSRPVGGAVTPSALRQARDEEVDLEALAELGKVTRRKKES